MTCFKAGSQNVSEKVVFCDFLKGDGCSELKGLFIHGYSVWIARHAFDKRLLVGS